jgi:hypothetical protein
MPSPSRPSRCLVRDEHVVEPVDGMMIAERVTERRRAHELDAGVSFSMKYIACSPRCGPSARRACRMKKSA